MKKEIIVFDIWSDFAHFRRGYTTTSSLTYPFPPKSTISGMISCFLGIPNEQKENNYYKIFTPENLKVGIRILNPVSTTMIKENLIETKKHEYFKYGLIDPIKGRTQIPIQFLKNPKFRVYVWFNEKLGNEKERFIEFLEQHKSFYTPYLGITECIANFKYIGVFKAQKIKQNENKEYEIDSVIPRGIGEIKVEEGTVHGTIRMPMFIDENRQPKLFSGFVYLEEGNPLEKEEDKKEQRNAIKLSSLKNKDSYLAVSMSDENVILF